MNHACGFPRVGLFFSEHQRLNDVVGYVVVVLEEPYHTSRFGGNRSLPPELKGPAGPAVNHVMRFGVLFR